jgi:hypothetical protein
VSFRPVPGIQGRLSLLGSQLASRRRVAALGFAGVVRVLAGLPAAAETTAQPDERTRAAAGSDNPFIVDVRDFGAKGDGIADDAPAINRAIAHLRTQRQFVNEFPVGPKLMFTSGVYLVRSTIDLTGLQILNMVLDGCGSVIVGACAGQPVMDGMGARWLMIRDLTIIGDNRAMPRIGLQIGRVTDAVADNHRFVNMKIIGYFGLACLVNVAAETTGFDHVFLWNYHDDKESYCLIQDGLNHFQIASGFMATRPARDQDDSFNENEFINCDFRHAGGGVPVFLGDTSRHRFYRCYAVGIGKAAFTIYCGRNSHDMLDIDCHCETGALRSVFIFAGSSPRPVIRGFSFIDHAAWASHFIFSREAPIEHVTLQHASIEIGWYPNPDCRVFEEPARWSISGTYYSSMTEQWNAGEHFKGRLFLGDSIRSENGADHRP